MKNQAIILSVLFFLVIQNHRLFCQHLVIKKYNDTITEYISSTSDLKSDIIPDSVFQLINLKTLSIQGMDCDYRITDEKGNDITECWMIYQIPTQIKNLKKLEELRLNVNAISFLPVELGELKQLKSIDLSDNIGLSDITPVTTLFNLESLSLFGCGLIKLPKDIGALKRLKYLGLTGNRIDKTELIRVKKSLPNCEVVF